MLFPPGVWTLALVALLSVLLLRYARFGRHVFAIGSNERTARLCGVEVERVKVAVYTLSAGLAGRAGGMGFPTLTGGGPTASGRPALGGSAAAGLVRQA